MVRHGFIKLSTLNIALYGRQPKFYKNPFLAFLFLFLFHFVFSFILLILEILVLFFFSHFVLYCLMCLLSVSGLPCQGALI